MKTCTKNQPAEIRCLQINMRHARAAALHLSQLLIDMDIDIVFIQEPYAVSDPNVFLKHVPDRYIPLSLDGTVAFSLVSAGALEDARARCGLVACRLRFIVLPF